MIFGAFAKLRKTTISFVMYVRLSFHLHWNNSAPTKRIFIKFQLVAQCLIQLRHRTPLTYFSVSVNSS